MEVDATIAEEFVEDDADYISAMKLAVSDDEEGSGGGIGIGITDDSGGCQASDSTCGRTKTVTGNRENGGTGDLASSKVNKRKFLHNLSDDGEKLYGFDEDTGRPIYGLEEKKPPIIATGTSKSDVDSSEHVASPPKKSRSSSDGIIESTLIKSSSQSPLPVATPVTPVPIVNSTAATTSVMSVSKPKSAKDEFYKKPFEFGWKRELVYRANPDTSKDKADVYFISPSGKKVRSRNEIAPLLDGELNVEHFSFAKEPLGVGSELEIVRNAKQSHRSATDSFHTSGISTSSGKRISKPKAPKGASPPPHGWTPTRALKNSSSLNTNSNSFATITGSSVGTSSMSAAASPKNTSKSGKSRKNNAALDTGVTGDNDFGSDRSKRHNSSSSNSHRKHISNTGGGQQQQHAITTTTSGSAVSAGLGSSHNSPSRNNNTSQQHNVYSVDAGSSSSQLSMSSSSTSSFASNFFANVSVGYDAILHIFKYLKIHERPRAASVCKIWNLVAKDRSLWQTVRMKNSKVSNWAGFTAALRRGETKHLDLRKLLVSSTKIEEVWSEFCCHIGSVQSLVHIDMCRCSAQVVESLFVTNPNLTVLSALAINDEYLNLINIDNLSMLQELRLRTLEKCTLASDLTPLRTLKNLRCLTLSSIRQLGNKTIEVLGELKNLVSLELGECNDFDTRFTDDVLPKLSNLERLRLEIGQDQCRTLEILDSVAKLKNLNQLEFVNFDIKPGFDHKLAKCTNIRKLLIIPTYISQSATTNNIVLNAVLNLRNTLQVFTWGVTVELLRVTALYVDQCEDSKRKERHHFDECIPVLKPVPGSPGTSCDVTKKDEHDEDDKEFKDGIGGGGMNAVPQIEILPLDKVDQILHESLVTTKYTIVKIPYHATWKQQLVE